MLMLRSTHIRALEKQAVLALSQQEVLRQGYHGRIEALEGHIQDLRKLVFISASTQPDPLVLEADNVISASEKPYEMSEEDQTRAIEGARELDLLMSGNYDDGMQ